MEFYAFYASYLLATARTNDYNHAICVIVCINAFLEVKNSQKINLARFMLLIFSYSQHNINFRPSDNMPYGYNDKQQK